MPRVCLKRTSDDGDHFDQSTVIPLVSDNLNIDATNIYPDFIYQLDMCPRQDCGLDHKYEVQHDRISINVSRC